MKIEVSKVKIVVMVPQDYLEIVRDTMCKAGAGIIGNYSYCSSYMKSIGTFIPNEEAHPFIGKNASLEMVNEYRLEVLCDINNVKEVLKKMREFHPYEDVSVDIIPLIDENYL